MAPSFATTLVDQTATEGILSTYTLPTINDPESNTCTVSIVTSPAYVSISGTVLTFSPPAPSAGTFPITLSVTDGVNTPQFSFNLIVVAN